MNLIILGAQGVGKGTIAEELIKKYKLVHLSSGDILRENVKKKTRLGKIAEPYMLRGALVPSNIIITMMIKRIKQIKKQNFILDGYPRNVKQARSLKQIKIDKVIHLKATKKTLIQRISGRRVCTKCQAVFHIKNLPPKKKGICDKCGSPLHQRADETPAAIKKRLTLYHKVTRPLIKFYKEQKILIEIDTEQPIKNIIKDTIKQLK